VAALPEFGRPVMRVASHYVAKALSQTGAGNVVSSIILDYRAYDTLGEAVVLVTAVMGALAVLRRPGRKTDAGSGEGT
jgi:multisubunit Na+/H+ antiporter MnhB subunit